MSGVTIRDEDWTISPKRYAGMNAGPTYDPFEEDRQLGDAIQEKIVRPTLEAYAKAKATVYSTLDSGNREQYASGMQRDPGADKVRWDLVVPEDHPGKPLIQRWAELMTRGAKKYSARNWELAESQQEYERFRESLFRHFMMYWLGYDDEDHAAAIIFNLEGVEYVKAKLSDPT